ncbi:MAG: helix-turn-helix domain-containing protein [Bacteroides sp.]|nr:helix-turn-helix domain-containing protein [Bacteroides sp.]MCM1549661.1 helix-turn-helix domain-containing protein [Clostridium sp.]
MIGDEIRLLRIRRNITQKELAKQINVATSTVSMYERNRRMPDIETIKRIAAYFNVHIEVLLDAAVPAEEVVATSQQEDDAFLSGTALSDAEHMLLDTFRSLPKEEQYILIGKAFELKRSSENKVPKRNDL